MLKRIACLAVVVGAAGCPSPPPQAGCEVNDDCDSGSVCVGGACVVIAGGEGEGEGEEGEGEEGEGEEGEGEGEEGEGEGEAPVDLTPRITSQNIILGAPGMQGNTFHSQGHIAVVSPVLMRGTTFRVSSTH